MPFPLDQKWIDAAEQELGKVLPDGYKNRLKRDNGGEIDVIGDSWILHPAFDQSDRKRLKRTCNHVLAETRSSKSRIGFPEDAIAITANGSGDLLILLVDEESGASYDSMVWFWNHETGQVEPVADFAEIAP